MCGLQQEKKLITFPKRISKGLFITREMLGKAGCLEQLLHTLKEK